MNVYQKLQTARVKLQGMPLKKSGKNTFAKYDYFELEDFLPTIQAIFDELKLCGTVTFSTEYAEITIFDTESDLTGFVKFSIPMAEASLKGCHQIQNVGAVVSYMRRYLWMLALEIVEHDAIDAMTGKEEKKKPASKQQHEPVQEVLSNEQIKAVVDDIMACTNIDDMREVYSAASSMAKNAGDRNAFEIFKKTATLHSEHLKVAA